MAKPKPNTPDPTKILAATFSTIAASLRAQADAADALAKLYFEADITGAAGAGSQQPGTSAAASPTPAATAVSLDELKKEAMKLVSADAGQRTRIDPIIVKHAGALVAMKDIPPEKYGAMMADIAAALGTKPAAVATSADDL